MRKSINNLKQDVPANFVSYFKEVAGASSFDVRDTDFEGVDQVLAEWNLEPKATEFLRYIKFADSASFHSLNFQIQLQNGAVEEYVASGTNQNGRIVLAYVHVQAWGTAIYPGESVRHCKKRVFKKKCHTHIYNRAFTASELQVIQNGLLGHAYIQLEVKFDELQSKLIKNPLIIDSNTLSKTSFQKFSDA